MTDMKRHGAWKSPAIVEGYIADSLGQKQKTMNKISSEINLPGSSGINSQNQEPQFLYDNSVDHSLINNNSNSLTNVSEELNAVKQISSGKDINFNFSNCSNVNIHIHTHKD